MQWSCDAHVTSQYIISTSTEHAEADTFFCFTSIMAEIGDNFTKNLDDSKAGIGKELNISRGLRGHHQRDVSYWFTAFLFQVEL